MAGLPTTTSSPWLSVPRPARHPRLESDHRTEVVVVGAGIAGLTTALLLARAGRRVTVLEGATVGSGVTGVTTAKVTVLHGAIHHRIEDHHGRDAARHYRDANQAGLELLERLHGELEVASPLERRAARTFAADTSNLPTLRRELDAARRAGVDARWIDDPDAPFPALAAIEVPDQWQFDPIPYLDALADAVAAHRDGHVFEHSLVRGMPDPRGHRLRCDGGTVTADHVVITTGIPFVDRGLFFARQEPERSYAMALRTPDSLPEEMWLGIDDPTRSIRTLPDPDDPGRRLLLVGGGGHVTGRHPDPISHHRELLTWAQRHVTVDEVTHRWSAQDYATADGLPFVGPMWPLGDACSVATGFAKWGFTNGSAAALTLAGLLEGTPPPWASTFDPARVGGTHGATELARLNGSVGLHMVRDHLAVLTGIRPDGGDEPDRAATAGPSRAGAPEGHVSRRGRHYVGRSDTPPGSDPCEVQAVCPHLGGVLAWNNAESSWDCPLHGSRFDRCGHLLQGPATRDLSIRPSSATDDR